MKRLELLRRTGDRVVRRARARFGSKPRIHLHALCWNERRILPYFMRHYGWFVDRIFIYDDGSTDASQAYLSSFTHVEVRRFPNEGDSLVDAERRLYNQCWKESRGEADWVITPNVDEHLYHDDILGYLRRCMAEGVSVIPALGYQMISDEFPQSDRCLYGIVRRGAPWVQMNKLLLFDPNAILEINYDRGIHTAAPTGRVCLPKHDELVLLHYKYLGFEYTKARHAELCTGLKSVDVVRGHGHKYRWSHEQLRADFDEVRRGSVVAVGPGAAPPAEHPAPRWWRSS